MVLITKDTIYCANAGDSRACLATKKGKVIELSYDHKPDNDGELKRVKAAGGFVEDGRVQGVIAVSRAIGDWEYKNPKLLDNILLPLPENFPECSLALQLDEPTKGSHSH